MPVSMYEDNIYYIEISSINIFELSERNLVEPPRGRGQGRYQVITYLTWKERGTGVRRYEIEHSIKEEDE